MNNQVALQILEEVLAEFRRESYERLTSRIGPSSPVVLERDGAGGPYQLEILFLWDGQPGGDVRVIGSIDDGGLWTAFAPLTRSFIKAADGSLVGE
jgi:hypothetical protein